MLYEMPKSSWTICSIPVTRVLPGAGNVGADRFPSNAARQPASLKQGQMNDGIKRHEGFDDAGMDNSRARQE